MSEEQFITKLNSDFDKKIVDIKLLNGNDKKVPFVFSDGFINELSKYAIENDTTTILSPDIVKETSKQNGYYRLPNFIRSLAKLCTDQNVLNGFMSIVPNADKSPLYKISEYLKSYKRDFENKELQAKQSNDIEDTYKKIAEQLTNYTDIRKIYLWNRDIVPEIELKKDTEEKYEQKTLFDWERELGELALESAKNKGLKVKEEVQEVYNPTKEELETYKEALEEAKKQKELEKEMYEEWRKNQLKYDNTIPDEGKYYR